MCYKFDKCLLENNRKHEKGELVDYIYWDLKKAFHKVTFKKFLQKLKDTRDMKGEKKDK